VTSGGGCRVPPPETEKRRPRIGLAWHPTDVTGGKTIGKPKGHAQSVLVQARWSSRASASDASFEGARDLIEVVVVVPREHRDEEVDRNSAADRMDAASLTVGRREPAEETEKSLAQLPEAGDRFRRVPAEILPVRRPPLDGRRIGVNFHVDVVEDHRAGAGEVHLLDVAEVTDDFFRRPVLRIGTARQDRVAAATD